MDAAVARADAFEREWREGVSRQLHEAAQSNQATALILVRIQERLDQHDKVLERIERIQAEAAPASLSEPAGVSRKLTLSDHLSNLIQDWRGAVMFGSLIVNVILALGMHLGLSWHW